MVFKVYFFGFKGWGFLMYKRVFLICKVFSKVFLLLLYGWVTRDNNGRFHVSITTRSLIQLDWSKCLIQPIFFNGCSNLRGLESRDVYLQKLPRMYMLSYQGSQSSTSEGILKVQKNLNLIPSYLPHVLLSWVCSLVVGWLVWWCSQETYLLLKSPMIAPKLHETKRFNQKIDWFLSNKWHQLIFCKYQVSSEVWLCLS